jgi:opacity protein-like surface antigen
MRKYLSTLLFVVCGATAAQAERPFNWTGFYVGAHGGYAGSTIDPLGPEPPAGAPSQKVEGGIVGLQVGAQYQWSGGVVTGVEADISFAQLKETVRDGNYLTQTGTIERFGTVRGRLGYAMGRFMPYVTGGLAWDRLTENQICPDPASVQFGHCRPDLGNAPYNLSQSKTNYGWAYGIGFEYAVSSHWSVRLEAMRLEFDTEEYNLGAMANGVQNPTKRFDHDIDLVRFATNMKF